MVGEFFRAELRHIGYHHAAAARRLHVDQIIAGPHTGQHTAVGQRGKQRIVDAGTEQEQAMAALAVRRDRRGLVAAYQFHADAGLPQQMR